MEVGQHVPQHAVSLARLLNLLVDKLADIVVTEFDAPQFIGRKIFIGIVIGICLHNILLFCHIWDRRRNRIS